MNLREWLFKNRMSIKLFASLINVDRTYIHKWMSGTHVPSDDILLRIRETTIFQVSGKEDLKDLRACKKSGMSGINSCSCSLPSANDQ